MNLRQGIVVATHPEDHSVDLVMTDDGTRLVGVQVLTPNGSARTGTFHMAPVTREGDKWDITKRTDQDQIAVVGYLRGNPIVVGFMYPQINQMTFKDAGLFVFRTPSDVIVTIDGSGNAQIRHPGGTYIRIGDSPEKVDVAGTNFDKNLAVDRNTDVQAFVRVGLAGGQVELTMDPAGTVTINAAQKITLDTPLVEATGMIVASGDVIGQNVSLATHVHPGVITGPMVTMPPVPTGGGASPGGGDTGTPDPGGGTPGGDLPSP